ncbi:MAG: LysR family transcriptional regulator [Alphaproteobacteria bacterium]|nr:LysR family transcriptional regulator [Alphaproteobacteria bacterium]
MRSLNLDQLRALETVVQLASFTAAAKRLNLSQSTVSVQIRELEQRFGLRLVERLGRRAMPTPAGRELVDHARRVAADVDLAAAAMQRHRDGSLGLVRVGTTTTALNYFLTPVLRSLGRRHPDVALTIGIDTTAGQVERVLKDEIDFGIVNLPVKDRSIVVTPLRTEELVAIFPASATDTPRWVTPQFLARHKLLLEAPRAVVKSLVLDWISPANRQLQPAMLLDNFDTIRRMVAIGLGASVVPASVLDDDKRRGELIVRSLRPKLQRTLGLVEHKNKPHGPAMKIFRDAILAARNI